MQTGTMAAARPATWSISTATRRNSGDRRDRQAIADDPRCADHLSIANDVAKYFAIIPAIFIAFYPQLEALNIMYLASRESAILSAIIFNALIRAVFA